MESPSSLKPFMHRCFASAKRLFLWSDVCAWTIGGLGVATAVLPESWGGVVWGAGVVGLLLLIAQQFLLYRFRKAFNDAERVKRAFLLADAQGRRIAASDLSELRKVHGVREVNDDSYYTSPHPPGMKRLLMLVWESAFWSADLQRVMAARYFWRAVSSTALVVVVCLGLWYWAAALGTAGPLVARVLLGIGSIIVSAEFWVRWRESEQTQGECDAIGTRCRSLLAQKKTPDVEVWPIVLDYIATTIAAYPIPDKLHAGRKQFLNGEWERIAADYAQPSK